MAEEPAKETRGKKKGKADENMIFVGKKPTMSYVLACVTQFNNGLNEIHIKARGKAISKAVDVAEITKNRFAEGAKIKDINVGTDVINSDEGEKLNVSTIDITLVR
ncbi:MAG: DNA-binding protein Alba [archaeon]|nr:MAG: DNA-binding protein Alba [archaeon]